ncbi:distal tail protein Dit [Listeria monocytogenes]|uniref:distal tail protein Dit n=1 Tax=Listeria monocytogenes TaxID=1639 RepID=UPI00086E9DAB|nr:distal tail protein Dit [Listeria monocytogenes]OEP70413.1 phage tail protein [Listeria monocytogenes]
MSLGFTYKGIHSFDKHVEIIDIKPPLFPQNEGNTESVSGRIGAFYFGPNVGQRGIQLEIQIIGDSLKELSERATSVADWLMQVDAEERSLVIDDAPEKTYYGRFEGPTDLDRLLYNGRATLNFVCSDPYVYYEQEEFELTSESNKLPVRGSQPTSPVIGAVIKQDVTYIAVSNKDDYLYIGEGVDPDTGETPLKPSEIVINDPMNDISRWASVTTNTLTFDLDYKNGKIDGSYTTTANVIKADDYGVGSQWHGPMSKVVLPQALDNWRIRMRLQNSASAQKQQGKLEIYLVDAQGRRIGLLQVKDNDANTEVNIMKLQIGAQYSTTYPEKNLFNETGTIKKTYKTVKKKKKVKGKWKIVTEKVQTGAYSETRDFYGYLILEKLGNKFNAQIVKLDSNLQPVWTKKATYTDKNNVYTRALQQLNIYSAAWSTRDPNKIMCFTDLRVEKLNIVANTAPQVIAHAGDEIHFDCETETVYKNGIPFMENFAIGSSWLSLAGGDSEVINVSPYDAADWTVSVRPRTF